MPQKSINSLVEGAQTYRNPCCLLVWGRVLTWVRSRCPRPTLAYVVKNACSDLRCIGVSCRTVE